MAQQSGAGRRRRHGSGLWQGAAVVVAAATLMASSPVDAADQPVASTPQDPRPARFEASTQAAGDAASTPSTPSAAPGTTAPTSSSPSAAAATGLAAGGIPSVARTAYDDAAAAAPADCGVAWSLIAAIGRVESDHGRFAEAVLQTDGRSAPRIIGIPLDGTRTALIRDTDGGRLDGDTVYDRAVGPMQFIPSTWARYASDGDGDGSSDPFDVHDAARATGRYLCAAGGDLTTVGGQRRAVLAYNHSDEYAATVLTLAARYAGTPTPVVPTDAVPPPSAPPANPAPPLAVQPAATPSSSALPSTTTRPTTPAAPTPPPVTTSPRTTAPATTPTVTAPPTTPPPVTTPPSVTTPPTVTPPPTTTPPADTTPPSTATPPATAPPSTTPPTATTPPTTPPPAPTPGCTTPAVASLGTVDIRDGSADPSAATADGARVAEAGGTVGAVTTTQDATSAVLYPDDQGEVAAALADALGLTGAAQAGTVDRITVVVGSGDAARLACAA